MTILDLVIFGIGHPCVYESIIIPMNKAIEALPRDHYGHIPEDVVSLLLKGRSVYATGIPGFGKTYFPRFIEKIVRAEYKEILAILINISLIETNEGEPNITQIKERIGCLPNQDIQTYLENLSKRKIVLIILEGLDSKVSPKVLNYFYQLGNINPTKIVFLTVGQYVALNKDFVLKSNAYPLFSKKIIIPPFDLEGAKRIIRINNEMYHWNITEIQAERIYKISGGNPALILYLSFYLTEFDTDDLNNFEFMLAYAPLYARVEDITNVIIHEPWEVSKNLGIVNEKEEIFSSLVEYHLRITKKEVLDVFEEKLSERERTVLSVLFESKDRLVEYEKLSKLLNQNSDTYSLWSMYKAIQRLKRKVSRFYDIKTVRDKGYMLVGK